MPYTPISNAAYQAELAERRARFLAIKSEMMGRGVPERVAATAAGALVNFPNAPSYGLSDHEDRILVGYALCAIDAHLEAHAMRGAA